MPKPRAQKFGVVGTASGVYLVGDSVAHSARHRRRVAEAFQDLDEVVYFVRFGDYIKIGTTANLRQRLRQLKGVQVADILAIMPGGPELERQMHVRFARSLAEKHEYFRPTPDLINYVNSLRAKAGVPHI